MEVLLGCLLFHFKDGLSQMDDYRRYNRVNDMVPDVILKSRMGDEVCPDQVQQRPYDETHNQSENEQPPIHILDDFLHLRSPLPRGRFSWHPSCHIARFYAARTVPAATPLFNRYFIYYHTENF